MCVKFDFSSRFTARSPSIFRADEQEQKDYKKAIIMRLRQQSAISTLPAISRRSEIT